MKYQPVIGLEVHVELNTKSKMFCRCSAQYFGEEPNTHTCPVCLGLPGALPVPNQKAIEWCVMIGMALNCETPLFSKFDRKNYFYPDLSKGYQISQYDEPFCVNGYIEINTNQQIKKRIRIRRVHMEEDTGKLLHSIVNGEKVSLIDFNRSGVPLVEIVTEPDFENAQEVKEYLQKLQQIIRYLDVSTADMEKGQMRLEPNISLREIKENDEQKINNKLPNYKVEVKNINSFRFVEKAINYEIDRQRKILEEGKIPTQETRGWDEKKQITYSQRVKEEAMDYRYFPEPDIPPIRWDNSQLSTFKSQLPELPDEKKERFINEYGLSEYSSEILTREKEMADFYEETIKASHEVSSFNPKDDGQNPNKQIADYIINKKIDIVNTLPAGLIKQILEESQTLVIPEEELKKAAKDVISENQKAVDDYKKGKIQIIGFLIAQVKNKVGQKTDVQSIKKILQDLLQ